MALGVMGQGLPEGLRMRSDAWAHLGMPLVGSPAGLGPAGLVLTRGAAHAWLSFGGCCAQHRELLSSVIQPEVMALWTLARAQLGLGRLDEASETLRWAAKDHALMCDDIAVAMLGWLGLDGEWPRRLRNGGNSVSAGTNDSICGACGASFPRIVIADACRAVAARAAWCSGLAVQARLTAGSAGDHVHLARQASGLE